VVYIQVTRVTAESTGITVSAVYHLAN